MTTTIETLSVPCTQPAVMSAESLMDSTLATMQVAFYLMQGDNLVDACRMFDLAPADYGTFNSLRNMYNVCETNIRVIGRWLALPQDGSGIFVAAHGADMQWPENLTALFTKSTAHTPRAWSLHS